MLPHAAYTQSLVLAVGVEPSPDGHEATNSARDLFSRLTGEAYCEREGSRLLLQPTRSDVQQALQDLQQRVAANDRLIVYLAVPVLNSSYLLLADSGTADPARAGLALEQFQTDLFALPAKHILLVLDLFDVTPGRSTLHLRSDRPGAVSPNLARLLTLPARETIISYNNPASIQARAGGGHTPLVRSLLTFYARLRKQQDDIWTVGRLFGEISQACRDHCDLAYHTRREGTMLLNKVQPRSLVAQGSGGRAAETVFAGDFNAAPVQPGVKPPVQVSPAKPPATPGPHKPARARPDPRRRPGTSRQQRPAYLYLIALAGLLLGAGLVIGLVAVPVLRLLIGGEETPTPPPTTAVAAQSSPDATLTPWPTFTPGDNPIPTRVLLPGVETDTRLTASVPAVNFLYMAMQSERVGIRVRVTAGGPAALGVDLYRPDGQHLWSARMTSEQTMLNLPPQVLAYPGQYQIQVVMLDDTREGDVFVLLYGVPDTPTPTVPSATPTATLTATLTATPTATLTAPPSATKVPGETGAPTATPTLTLTATPSSSPTATFSPASTLTPTEAPPTLPPPPTPVLCQVEVTAGQGAVIRNSPLGMQIDTADPGETFWVDARAPGPDRRDWYRLAEHPEHVESWIASWVVQGLSPACDDVFVFDYYDPGH